MLVRHHSTRLELRLAVPSLVALAALLCSSVASADGEGGASAVWKEKVAFACSVNVIGETGRSYASEVVPVVRRDHFDRQTFAEAFERHVRQVEKLPASTRTVALGCIELKLHATDGPGRVSELKERFERTARSVSELVWIVPDYEVAAPPKIVAWVPDAAVWAAKAASLVHENAVRDEHRPKGLAGYTFCVAWNTTERRLLFSEIMYEPLKHRYDAVKVKFQQAVGVYAGPTPYQATCPVDTSLTALQARRTAMMDIVRAQSRPIIDDTKWTLSDSDYLGFDAPSAPARIVLAPTVPAPSPAAVAQEKAATQQAALTADQKRAGEIAAQDAVRKKVMADAQRLLAEAAARQKEYPARRQACLAGDKSQCGAPASAAPPRAVKQ